MGAVADKVKGTANEAIGKAKQGIGEATGSDRLQGEGVIQEIKGKGQKAVGDAKQATKDAVNTAAATKYREDVDIRRASSDKRVEELKHQARLGNSPSPKSRRRQAADGAGSPGTRTSRRTSMPSGRIVTSGIGNPRCGSVGACYSAAAA